MGSRLVRSFLVWTVHVGAHAVWITLIIAKHHITRKYWNSLADSLPNSLCIDVAKMQHTFSTFQVWESTHSKSSIGFKITLVQTARNSKKSRNVYRPKMKRSANVRFSSKSRKNYLIVQGEKNRKEFRGRINPSLITISNTHSTITNSNSSGKVGITNNRNNMVGNSNKRPRNSKLRTLLPRGCGGKKWLLTSKPKGWHKISCVCYVAFVKISITRIFVWEFLNKKSAWRRSVRKLIFPSWCLWVLTKYSWSINSWSRPWTSLLMAWPPKRKRMWRSIIARLRNNFIPTKTATQKLKKLSKKSRVHWKNRVKPGGINRLLFIITIELKIRRINVLL